MSGRPAGSRFWGSSRFIPKMEKNGIECNAETQTLSNTITCFNLDTIIMSARVVLTLLNYSVKMTVLVDYNIEKSVFCFPNHLL